MRARFIPADSGYTSACPLISDFFKFLFYRFKRVVKSNFNLLYSRLVLIF